MIIDNPTVVVEPCKNGECPEAPAPKLPSFDAIARSRFSNPDVRTHSGYSGYAGALSSVVMRLRKDLAWDTQLGQERAAAARSAAVSALYWMCDGLSHEAIDEDIDAALAFDKQSTY